MTREGWTDKMIDPGTPYNETPEIGGDRAEVAAAKAAETTEDKEEKKVEMGTGEKYWHDKSKALEEELNTLRPLGEFADVIGYLDANPEAVTLISDHMKGSREKTQDYINDLDSDFGGLDKDEPTAPPVQAPPKQQSQVDKIQQKLAEDMNTYLMENGIPEHEKDKFLQFLINPGELKPDELYGMYKQLNGSRETGSEATDEKPKGPSVGEPMKQSQMAPMSVANMAGSTADPAKEAKIEARAKSRTMMDPNNL